MLDDVAEAFGKPIEDLSRDEAIGLLREMFTRMQAALDAKERETALRNHTRANPPTTPFHGSPSEPV